MDEEKRTTLNDMIDGDEEAGDLQGHPESTEARDALKDFVDEHFEALELFWGRENEKRIEFIKSLTIKDFERLYKDRDVPDEISRIFTTGTDEDKIDFFYDLPMRTFINLYESKKRGPYRTRAKASGAERRIPEKEKNLAIITLKGYQYGMSFHQEGNAYLQPLANADKLRFQNGKLYLEGKARPISEAELQDMVTQKGIEDIDLVLLKFYYNIILSKFESNKFKKIEPVISMYMPDIAKRMGLKGNLNKQGIDTIINNTQKYHGIVGVMRETRNGKDTPSRYPVLNFEGYDSKKNVISFSSPYMNHLIETIYNLAIRRDRKGNIKQKTSGEPQLLPTHSYLVKAEILKERNKDAVMNVFNIVTTIEQAGSGKDGKGLTPNISVETIVKRNPQLQKRLEETKNPAVLLKRCFKKTLQLLRDETRLQEVYKDIELPNPDDPAQIPTPSTFYSTVYKFPHHGKKKNKDS